MTTSAIVRHLPARPREQRGGLRFVAAGLVVFGAVRAEGADAGVVLDKNAAFPPAWDSWAVPPIGELGSPAAGPLWNGGSPTAVINLTLTPPGSRDVNVDLAGMGYASVKVKAMSTPAAHKAAVSGVGSEAELLAREARPVSLWGRNIARASPPRPHGFSEVNGLVSFQTGDAVLTSYESAAFPTLGAAGTEFRFQIGFETAELPGPGSIFDSLTVSLRGAGGSPVATLVTMDAFGLTPAPATAGGLSLDLADISFVAVSELVPATLPRTQTFDVTVTLPSGFANQPLTVALDFFDNQNGFASKAHIAVVPEPGTVALFVTGLAALVWARRKQG